MPRKTQSYANHRRFMPLFHFFVVPILVGNVVVASVLFARDSGLLTGWNLVVAIALAAAALAARLMALTVQNRLIRLEERSRLERLLPEEHRARLGELRTLQLAALRFAPDDEVPELAKRTLDGELRAPRDIKQAVRNWRADFLRV